jgi:hypothetical protein
VIETWLGGEVRGLADSDALEIHGVFTRFALEPSIVMFSYKNDRIKRIHLYCSYFPGTSEKSNASGEVRDSHLITTQFHSTLLLKANKMIESGERGGSFTRNTQALVSLCLLFRTGLRDE